MSLRRRVRAQWHDLTRDHYDFSQGDTRFFICDRRWRWQRDRTEYAVMMGDNLPVIVTREQFVNLDRRLTAEAVATLDEAIELLEANYDDVETTDTEED